MSDLNIDVNVNGGGSLDETGKKLDNLGHKAEGANQHVGGLRKNIRAVGETSKVAGSAMGSFGGELGSVGEAGKIAYASFELMEGGLKNLGKVILDNPIFVVAAVIAGVVLKLIEMNKETKESEKKFAETGKELEKFKKSLTDTANKLAEADDNLAVASGTMTKEAAKLNKERREGNKELQAQGEEHKELLSKMIQDQERLKKAYTDAIISPFGDPDKVKKELDENIKRVKEFSGEITKQDYELLQTQAVQKKTAAVEEANEKKKEKDKEDKKSAEERKKQLAEEEKLAKERGKILEELRKVKQGLLDAGLKDAEEAAKKQKKIDDELADEEVKKIQENLASRKELIEKNNEDSFQGRLENIQIDMDAELKAVGDNEAAKQLIREKYADKTKELNKQTADATISIASETVNSLSNLEDVVSSIKDANLKKGSAAQLAAAKKEFKIKKALSITSAVISGIQGVVNALSAQSVIPEPFGTVLKVATAVGVGVASAANVAKIASTQFNEGATGGGSATTGSSPSAPSGNFSAASLQKIGGASAPNLMGPGNGNNTGKPPVSKVYVVSQDLTKSQNKDAVLERRASFNH